MVDNKGGTFITVNNAALITELKKSIKTAEESLKNLQTQLGACEHFKLKLNSDIKKSLLLLETNLYNIFKK